MRLETGRTPAAPAEKVGVPRQTVADLEAGKSEPRSDLIERVAVAQGRLTPQPGRIILSSAAMQRTLDEGQARHGS